MITLRNILEVKKSSKSVKQVKKYQKKFGDSVRKAMVVTLDEEGVADGVSVVPAWKFLLGGVVRKCLIQMRLCLISIEGLVGASRFS